MKHTKSTVVASMMMLSISCLAQELPEPVRMLHRFSGDWEGIITFEMRDPATGNYLAIRVEGGQTCQVNAGGYSIECQGRFNAIDPNSFFETFEESIQGGYSVPDAQIVWAYVYSIGEAGALTGNWNGDRLELSRSFIRDGITLRDAGAWHFTSSESRDFLAETTAPDGTVLRRIHGTLKR